MSALVTDEVITNVGAKKIIRKKRPDIVTIRCFAHLVNLICKDMFESGLLGELDHLQEIAKKSRKAEFDEIFEKTLEESYKGNYGKRLRLMAPTRWNNSYDCCYSFLRKKTAVLGASKK